MNRPETDNITHYMSIPKELSDVTKMIMETREYDKGTLKALESMMVTAYSPDHIFCDGKMWYTLIVNNKVHYWKQCYHENPYIYDLRRYVLYSMQCIMIEAYDRDPMIVLSDRDHIASLQKNFLKWLTKFDQPATHKRLIKQAACKYPTSTFNQHSGLLFSNGQLHMGKSDVVSVDAHEHLIQMIPYDFIPISDKISIHDMASYHILHTIFNSVITVNKTGIAQPAQIYNIYGSLWNEFGDWMSQLLGRYVAFIKTNEVTKRVSQTIFSKLLKDKKLAIVLCGDELVNISGFKTLLGNYHHLCWCFVSTVPLELDSHGIKTVTMPYSDSEFSTNHISMMSQSYSNFLTVLQ